MADETRDAEEPLLEHVIEDGDPDRQEDQGGDLRANFATLHLANTMVGAGIVALPKTFATLGLLLGGTLIAFVAWLSYFSLAGLTHAANVTKSRTFAELAGLFGPRGAAAQKVAIVFNNGGSMVIYLIIMGDLLVGVAPDYSGLITNLIGVHDPSVWYVSRPFVVSALPLMQPAAPIAACFDF
jgi:amino acid permease